MKIRFYTPVSLFELYYPYKSGYILLYLGVMKKYWEYCFGRYNYMAMDKEWSFGPLFTLIEVKYETV